MSFEVISKEVTVNITRIDVLSKGETKEKRADGRGVG